MWKDLVEHLQVYEAESSNGELGSSSLPIDLGLPTQTIQDIVEQLESGSLDMESIIEPEGGIDEAKDPTPEQTANRMHD